MMRNLIEYGLLCCYKSPVMKWFVTSPSVFAFLLWCYTAFNEHRKITQLANPSATYCLYGNYLYYMASFGAIISIIFIMLAALPFFMDRQARGDRIMETLPGSASSRCVAGFLRAFIICLIALFMMLFTIMAEIYITDLLLPELSLSLYDRRLQFLEYSIRLVLNMTGIVFIQTSLHYLLKSVYLPIAFGGIMVFLTDGIYNPFFAMMNRFEGNLPLF